MLYINSDWLIYRKLDILKGLIRILISSIILFVFFYKLNVNQVLSTILHARFQYLALAVVVYSLTFLILSSRWRMILAHMGCSLPVLVAYQAFAGGMIVSDLTPARIGDVSRPLLVRDRLSLSTGMVSIAIDRYADIFTTFSLGVSGMILLLHRNSYAVLSVTVVLILLLGLAALWVRRPLIIKFIERLNFARLNELLVNVDDTISSMKEVRWVLGRAILLTTMAWIFQALRVLLIAKSIGYDIPLGSLFLLQPLVSILALVPITFSGLGLVEGGMTALLFELGIPAASGMSVALMDRTLTVAFHILAGGRYAAKIL